MQHGAGASSDGTEPAQVSSAIVNSPSGFRTLSSRLKRSASYLSKNLKPTLRSPICDEGALTHSLSSSSTPKLVNAPFTPFERFLKLTRKRNDGIELPLEAFPEAVDSSDSAITVSHLSYTVEVNESQSAIEEITDQIYSEPANAAGQPVQSAAESALDPIPEPNSLARKIQALLTSLPGVTVPYGPNTPFTATEIAPSTRLPALIADSRLVSLLSSPSVMSGAGSGDRQSVWSLLDSMIPPRATQEEQHGYDSDTSVMSMSESDASDDSSVMFCAPLEPDDTSEVELARSEVISLSDGSFAGADERTEARPRGRLAGLGPFGVGGEVASEATGPPSQDPRPVERKVWVPSATKISLEVRWWGYRVYLPPSVLAVLDNHRIQASKRAALLTTALKWLLDHVPITAVPLQMRPALHLLRGLVPYLAYTGAFIAWSWSAVKMFDKGHGVVLTATWLLPLALIPGAWEENMFAEADRPAADETDRPAAR